MMSGFESSFFTSEFLKGQRDCSKGKPHQSGMSNAYDRGYAAQYQHEQNMDALTDKSEAANGR